MSHKAVIYTDVHYMSPKFKIKESLYYKVYVHKYEFRKYCGFNISDYKNVIFDSVKHIENNVILFEGELNYDILNKDEKIKILNEEYVIRKVIKVVDGVVEYYIDPIEEKYKKYEENLKYALEQYDLAITSQKNTEESKTESKISEPLHSTKSHEKKKWWKLW